MAFYYVKNDGTATGNAGRYASQQTGTFADLGVAGYYPSMTAALGADTIPAEGDFIFLSDIHSTSASTSTWAFPEGGIAFAISVSDTNIEVFSAGATETETNISFSGKGVTWGMTYNVTSNISVSANDSHEFNLCTFNMNSSFDRFQATSDGSYMKFNDCQYNFATTTNSFEVSGGGKIEVFGGAINATTTVDRLLLGPAINGGGTFKAVGFDISAVTDWILFGHGAGPTSDDIINITLDRCQLNSTPPGFIQEQQVNVGTRLIARNCSGTSAGAEFQFHIEDYFGIVEDQDSTGIVRDETETTKETSSKVSLKITTTDNCSKFSRFEFEMPTQFVELSSSSSDTLRFYIATQSSLTDTNFTVNVYYADGTNKNVIRRATNIATDILSAGTALTTDVTSTWLNTTSENLYQIDIDTSLVATGADSIPIITVCVGLPSATIYMDSQFDPVA